MLQELGERIRDVRAGTRRRALSLTDNSAGRVLRVKPAK